MAFKNKTIEDLIKDGSIKMGNDPSLIIRRISTGLNALDDILGGGIPLGKIIEFYGQESTGKTLMAQYIAKAIQASDRPNVLLLDMEDSFDQEWWKLSGVDIDKLWVSAPPTGEDAIDIMCSVLRAKDNNCGLIIVDSIAGFVPAPEMDPEKSAEDKSMGLQAKLITLMFRKVKGLLGDTVLLMTNQMRDSLNSQYDEIGALPGGRANRHYCHILMKTRKDSWINDGKNHIGFQLEIINRKNKLATIADGESITMPFLFTSQIDATINILEEAIEQGLISRNGPYYKFGDKGAVGKAKFRTLVTETPELFAEIQAALTAARNN